MQIHVRHAPLVQVWVENELAYDVVRTWHLASSPPRISEGKVWGPERAGIHIYI